MAAGVDGQRGAAGSASAAMSWSLQELLKAFAGWIGANWPVIEQSHRRFGDEAEVKYRLMGGLDK